MGIKMSLGVDLRYCPFNRMLVLASFLVSMTRLTIGSWPDNSAMYDHLIIDVSMFHVVLLDLNPIRKIGYSHNIYATIAPTGQARCYCSLQDHGWIRLMISFLLQ